KYPESEWAQPVIHWEAGVGLRGWLHRIAAGVLLASLAVHLAHLVRSRRARACIAAMLPPLQHSPRRRRPPSASPAMLPPMEDFRESKPRLPYSLGREPLPPHGVKLG